MTTVARPRAPHAGDATPLALSRRGLFGAATGLGVGAALGPGLITPASAASAVFPGHNPDKIFVGLTGGGWGAADDLGAPVGLRRLFKKWDQVDSEIRDIRADHAANRIPWISFKPPGSTPGSWQAIARGQYDSVIRARARAYATLSKPVVVTFNHEPHTDNGSGSDWAAAWCKIHDVMKSETNLKNVLSTPIGGEWVFNPANKQNNPEDYITSGVLSRMAFLGIDLYQNSSGEGYAVRLDRIVKWLDGKGYSNKMVGLGETGCSDDFRSPTGAAWWTASWNWAVNSNRVFGITYFNSRHNNNNGWNWLLTQSAAKMNAFRASVQSSHAARLT